MAALHVPYNNDAMKKILICGASGFIGRNLFETLDKKNGLEVYGTYRSKPSAEHPRMLHADLTQRADVERVVEGMDVIIQAAATTSGAKDIIQRPYVHVTDNVIMNALLQQAAFDHGVPQYIFLSCTTIYPVMDRPIREADLDLNKGVYEKYFGGGWMKIYVEKLCEFYSRLGKTRYTVVRHSNIYGPHDKYDLERSHVFGATIAKVMNAKDKITVWGEGKEERDFLYIDDLTAFIEKAIERQDYIFDVFNVGLGQGTAIRDLVHKVIYHSGKKLTVEYDTSQPTLPINVAIDISKAKEKFAWQPRVTLDEGIKKTIDWYLNNAGQTPIP